MPAPWSAYDLHNIPDVIGSFRVYRTIRFVSGYLQSVHMNYRWVSGWNDAAHPGGTAAHTVPRRGCACGFYAMYLPDTETHGDYWQPHLPEQLMAVAEASGRIIPSELGVRAGKMKIVAVAGAPTGFDLLCGQRTMNHYRDVAVYSTARAMLRDFPPGDVSALTGGVSPYTLRARWQKENGINPQVNPRRPTARLMRFLHRI